MAMTPCREACKVLVSPFVSHALAALVAPLHMHLRRQGNSISASCGDQGMCRYNVVQTSNKRQMTFCFIRCDNYVLQGEWLLQTAAASGLGRQVRILPSLRASVSILPSPCVLDNHAYDCALHVRTPIARVLRAVLMP